MYRLGLYHWLPCGSWLCEMQQGGSIHFCFKIKWLFNLKWLVHSRPKGDSSMQSNRGLSRDNRPFVLSQAGPKCAVSSLLCLWIMGAVSSDPNRSNLWTEGVMAGWRVTLERSLPPFLLSLRGHFYAILILLWWLNQGICANLPRFNIL